MNKEDFKFYQRLLLEASGLSLTHDKIYLLTTRLEPVARNLGLRGLPELTMLLRQKPEAPATTLVVQAMTTRETSFFRDMKPFTYLKENIFSALLNQNAATPVVRIWSAGCATGQEPYSIAMVAREFFRPYPKWAVEIVATDIAEDALAYAEAGSYAPFEAQRGLSMKLMLENFTLDHDNWKIQDELKRMVRFGKFNLLDPMDAMGRFDIIFCRNVLIYFDAPTKKSVLDRLGKQLKPNGSIFLGACESVMGLGSSLKASTEMPGIHILAGTTAPVQQDVRK